jgi:hypothetical protein
MDILRGKYKTRTEPATLAPVYFVYVKAKTDKYIWAFIYFY